MILAEKMKLHLIRHAKANQSSDSGQDIDRPLSAKGIRQANALKHFISKKIITCKVLCSDSNRTAQTFAIINEENIFKDISYLNELYLCSYTTYLNFIWQNETNNDLMIVGHNFGISDLANYFCESDIEMQTGEYVCIDFDQLLCAETFKGTGRIIERYRL